MREMVEETRIELVVEGSTYSFDVSNLTFRELGVVERVAGVRGRAVGEALQQQDPRVLAAFAICAMRRAGIDVNEDAFLDRPAFATIGVSAPAASDPPTVVGGVAEATA